MLSSREEIMSTSSMLARRLSDKYKELKGKPWTEHIFNELRDFCTSELLVGVEDCFHKHHPTAKNEFLWDFLAVSREKGVLLAAESEQEAHNVGTITALKHDFEKLLYVYAPLRVLICKMRNHAEAEQVVEDLKSYALGCCQAFNPGAVFLIHIPLWDKQGTLSYVWQSEGKANPRKREAMNFALMSQAGTP